jgi:AmmeMemoRadiSam system protein B
VLGDEEKSLLRKPIVAGRFYPARAEACRAALEECFTAIPTPADLPRKLQAGLVPHAGWVCSGRVAARVFAALATQGPFETVVLFGAVHRWAGTKAALYTRGAWQTPLGDVEVDDRLGAAVLAESADCADEPSAHADEHSLEVQTPFVQWAFPQARILPIMVPAGSPAARIGAAVIKAIAATGRVALVVGTTDLTHYGPAYGFIPKGRGDAGLRWAKDVNDRRMVDLIVKRGADEVIPEALQRHNACGPGAVAATLAAAVELGANRTAILEHTTSAEVLGGVQEDAVGYLGAVFGNNEADQLSRSSG